MKAVEALRRLKENGRLSALPAPATALSATDVNSAIARAAERMVNAAGKHGARRRIAPGINLMVLP